MCGRAKLTTPGPDIAREFGLDEVPELEPRWNIAPTQPIPAVRYSSRLEKRTLAQLRWGLVPGWAKDPKIGVQCINARVETVATKSHFSKAFKARRCLIVADGFYEWQGEKKARRPLHIHKPDGAPFAFAGLWDRWVSKDGEVIESCAIVTTASSGVIASLHDRMPVILAPDDYTAWLDRDTPPEALDALMKKPPPELVVEPVSTYVNKADHEGKACVAPPEAEPEAKQETLFRG